MHWLTYNYLKPLQPPPESHSARAPDVACRQPFPCKAAETTVFLRIGSPPPSFSSISADLTRHL